MPYTATIANVVQERTNIRVFIHYSDGTDESFVFDSTVTKQDVINKVHPIIDALNNAEAKATSAQPLIGTVIS